MKHKFYLYVILKINIKEYLLNVKNSLIYYYKFIVFDII